jgi:apolipoprotein N-acyltransferase
VSVATRYPPAPPATTRPSFTVIVPALNEEDNLRGAVEAVLREMTPVSSWLEVLVFDDRSTDRTGEIADTLAREDPRVKAFHNPERLNMGGIYKEGVRRARADYVFMVPGDGEQRVDEIARVVPHLAKADLLVFYVTNTGVRPWGRRALSRLYVWVVNRLYGTRFRYTNGTNIFRTPVVQQIAIETSSFAYATEAVVKAVRSGVDFAEVGVEIQPRDSGTSKAFAWKNVRTVATSLGRLWWDVAVKHRARYRRQGRALGAF